MRSSAEETFYRRHHDCVGESFDNGVSFERASQVRGHRYFCLHDAIQSPGQQAALECGVGSFNGCAFLSRFFGSYTAIDIATPQAEQKFLGRVAAFNLIKHNLNEAWPFSASQFDVVLAMMVFEHLFDPFFSFSETARVLRPGGVALVNLPIVTSVKNRVRLLCGKLPLTSSCNWWRMEEWDGGHLHLFNIPMVKKLCAKYGMRVTRMYPCGRYPQVKQLWPSGLCGELSFVIRKLPISSGTT